MANRKHLMLGKLKIRIIAAVFLIGGCFSVGAARAATNTYAPTPIAFSDAEIPNPWRGSYQWNWSNIQPDGWPVTDYYVRYYWNQIETAKDVYDFSDIEKNMNIAKARGGKFGFRIMAVNPSCGCDVLPQYLKDGMNGEIYSGGNVIPNWNDSFFLERVKAVIAALGARYNNDLRLGYVDMGFYGAWGEWHLSSLPSMTAMTQANQHAIIDAMNVAFPNKYLNVPANDYDYFYYALSLSPRWGWRNDCVANSWFTQNMSNILNKTSVYNPTSTLINRWQTSPSIGEFGCDSQDMSLALSQAKTYHLANIGNGNFGSLTSYSASQQADYTALNKTTGYRIVLNSVSLPSPIAAGTAFSLLSNWSNEGVTPAYHYWDTYFQLRNLQTNVVAWEGKSALALATFLPTNGQQKSITDNFVVPVTLPAGKYLLSAIAKDPDNYYPPLRLAITGRLADGSYPLGEVLVSTSGKLGDANGDGKTDDLDYLIWAKYYGLTNATGPEQGDFNGDRRVDDLDYVVWAGQYGSL